MDFSIIRQMIYRIYKSKLTEHLRQRGTRKQSRGRILLLKPELPPSGTHRGRGYKSEIHPIPLRKRF